MNLNDYIATIPDFPSKGIIFRDVTPLLADAEAFKEATKQLSAFVKEVEADVIVGPESRGFMFGCPVAIDAGIGFVPARKPGKLPRATVAYKYDLEYGSNEIHIHADAIKPGQKVVIIDDLLATGGTVEATKKLIEQLGGEVVGCAFAIELDELKGAEKLEGAKVFSLLHY